MDPQVRAALLLLLSLTGCRDPGTHRAGAELRVLPSSLEFPNAWVGAERSLGLELSNSGTAPSSSAVAVAPPFFVDAIELRLVGGEAREVAVKFRPEAAGHFEGVLEVGAMRVSLLGDASAPPECGTTSDCRSARFDLQTEACVEEPLPDGQACGSTNGCLVAGRCSAGDCLGEAVDCDDHDPCTLDSCSSETGCLHGDGLAACPQPATKCEVATCDRARGCGIGLAADGTACGAADCSTAEVCIAGGCTTRAVPDGTRCGVSTLCQAQGTCHNQVCNTPGAAPLASSWSYTPGPSRLLVFNGHVDLQGNVFFLEPTVTTNGAGWDDWTNLELVSFDRTGVERFRVRVSSGCALGCAYDLQLALDPAGQRLFLTLPGNTLQARSLVNGTLLWQRDTTAGIPVRHPTPTGDGAFYTFSPMLLGNGGQMGVIVSEGYLDHWAHLSRFDRATGQPGARTELKGYTYGAASWGPGELAVSSANDWALSGDVARFDSNGVKLSAAWADGRLEAAIPGATFVKNYFSSRVLRDGLPPVPVAPPAGQYFGGEVLMTPSRVIATTGSTAWFLNDYDLATGAPRWSASLADLGLDNSDAPFLALLSDGSVFLAGTHVFGGGMVSTFGVDGTETLRCPLPGPPSSPVALRSGRLVTQIGASLQSFDLGTLDTARSGWAGPLGGPARDSVAQP